MYMQMYKLSASNTCYHLEMLYSSTQRIILRLLKTVFSLFMLPVFRLLHANCAH